MCVAITTPNRAFRPTLEQLAQCEHANRHGSGLAWLNGKRVEYCKNLPIAEIHRLLADIAGPAIVHFRIASVGGVDPQLCHPFPITHRAELRQQGTARSVLFHNGTWAEHRSAAAHYGLTFPKREPLSDTRIAASLIARFGFDWLKRADYCRWALLDRKGIRRIGHWHEVDGCHYSNLGWQPHTFGGSYEYLQPGFFDDDDDDDCEPGCP
jgi:hypothetical protein